MSESAIDDADRLRPLYEKLMPKDGPLALEAVTIVPEIFQAVGRTDEADEFLAFVLEMVEHRGGEVIHPALRSHVRQLEELSTSEHVFTAQLAVDLLGYCGPDDDLAARLRQRVGQDDAVGEQLLIAVARLQAAQSFGWLKGFLAPRHSPALRVTAVAALRLAGSPVLPGMDDVVVSAWESDPAGYLPNESGAGLRDLVGYLGVQVLERLGASTSPDVRARAAGALSEVAMPDHSLLRTLLRDPEEKVQKRAWGTLCGSDELARQNADLLVQAVNDGHPVRFTAANVLAKLGDERALPLAVTAIRCGKAARALRRMVADQDGPLDDASREVVLERIMELAKQVGKPGHGFRPVSELSDLLRVIQWRGGPECITPLVRVLEHTDKLGTTMLRGCLAVIGEGDQRAISALEATSDGSLPDLAQNWSAGGDEQALRRAIAAAPPDNRLASRLREILDGHNL